MASVKIWFGAASSGPSTTVSLDRKPERTPEP